MKFFFITVIFLSGFIMCNPKDKNEAAVKQDDKTVQEKNKNMVKAVFEELINKRNTAAIDDFYDQKMIDHGAWEGQKPGIEGFKKAVNDFLALFPDLQVKVDQMIPAGDIVATKDSWKGTHVSSKKMLSGETMHVFRIVNGKITEEWSNGWEWLDGLQ